MSSIVVFFVAHRQAKREAFSLFEKGFYPPDIAASLSINIRTAQRWFQDFKGVKPAKKADKHGGEVAAFLAKEEEEKWQSYLNRDWVLFAKKLSHEHFTAHENARQKIQELLDYHLSQPDLNGRIIHILSLALARHTEAERVAVSLDQLDMNRAAARLEKEGYIISSSDEYG